MCHQVLKDLTLPDILGFLAGCVVLQAIVFHVDIVLIFMICGIDLCNFILYLGFHYFN